MLVGRQCQTILPFITSVCFSALALAEVEIKDGSAHATSEHPAPWTADKAFNVGHNVAWSSKHDPITNKYDRFPILVWYEFPAENTFIPGRVSFRGRQDTDEGRAQTPTQWQFVGSNDARCGKFGKWTVLCEDRSNFDIPITAWTKYCDVDEKIFKKYKCLGINVLNAKFNGGHTSFRDVRMWEKMYE